MRIYAWNEFSRSAKQLASKLGIKRIRHNQSRYAGSPRRVVLNYGASVLPENILRSRIINNPQDVARASNKRSFFETMAGPDGPRVPDWTTDAIKALKWHKEGLEVIARTKLSAHSGDGIVFLSDVADVGQALRAPLYTVYKKKKEEFRVHVFDGKVIDVQKKLLRSTDDAGNRIDPETVDFRVRNLQNGFIYARNDIVVPADVETQAIKAFRKSGLDFGAVDVIWNNHEEKAYVLEINTAPGLAGTTLDNYVIAIKALGAL